MESRKMNEKGRTNGMKKKKEKEVDNKK